MQPPLPPIHEVLSQPDRQGELPLRQPALDPRLTQALPERRHREQPEGHGEDQAI